MNTQKLTTKLLSFILFTVLVLPAQAQLASADSFSEGEFLKELCDKKNHQLKSGATIISEFKQGFALTKLDDKYGLINKDGIEICQPVYDYIRIFEHGFAPVEKNKKWGVVNAEGDLVVAPKFSDVKVDREGQIMVQKSGKWKTWTN